MTVHAVDAEIICKAVRELLIAQLKSELDACAASWAAPQQLPQITIEPDPLPLPCPLPSDISIGRLDTILAESNFPAIWIFIQSEAGSPGEQAWFFSSDVLVIRVLVHGTTPAETLKLAYRYADCVRRVVIRSGTIFGAVSAVDPPSIDYGIEVEQGLYVAAELSFPIATPRTTG